MRAGLLRYRITIEQNTPARDGFGAEVANWITFATLWASITTVSGSEVIEQQRAAALLTHQIVIRYYAGVAPAMRVNWSGRLFDIQAVLDDQKTGEMQLLCNEVIHA